MSLTKEILLGAAVLASGVIVVAVPALRDTRLQLASLEGARQLADTRHGRIEFVTWEYSALLGNDVIYWTLTKVARGLLANAFDARPDLTAEIAGPDPSPIREPAHSVTDGGLAFSAPPRPSRIPGWPAGPIPRRDG